MANRASGINLLTENGDWTVVIDYTNHRGERAKRVINPIALNWGTTEWHPEAGFLLRAYDVGKRDYRTFAVKDIHGVEPAI